MHKADSLVSHKVNKKCYKTGYKPLLVLVALSALLHFHKNKHYTNKVKCDHLYSKLRPQDKSVVQ